MKKTIYLLLALLTARPSMTIQNNSSFFSRVLVGIGLSALVSNKGRCDGRKKRSLELCDLDEKQVLGLILNNYLRKTRLKTHVPNELRGLIYRFFIDEWAIQGFNKETGTGYDAHGFDIRGIHKETKKCLDPRGFGQNGFYKDVDPTTGKPTRYDLEGYNIDRWHEDGLHENGHRVDDNGFAQDLSHANIALYKAIENVDIKAVNLLLKQPNINVNLKKYGLTPLIWCCIEGDKSLGIAKALLEHPDIDIDVKDINGNTPLMWCCKLDNQSLQIAKLLLGHANIDVNVQDIDGATPLIVCCIMGDKSLRIAKRLLDYENINVNLADNAGNTPLLWCCWKGNQSLGIAKSLLAHANIDVNLKDRYGNTPLDMMIKCGVLHNNANYAYIKLWHMLIAKGAILNQHKNNYNNLSPSNFKETQQTYIRWIKHNPPKNSINTKFIESQQ